jgi:hypothetical protein
MRSSMKPRIFHYPQSGYMNKGSGKPKIPAHKLRTCTGHPLHKNKGVGVVCEYSIHTDRYSVARHQSKCGLSLPASLECCCQDQNKADAEEHTVIQSNPNPSSICWKEPVNQCSFAPITLPRLMRGRSGPSKTKIGMNGSLKRRLQRENSATSSGLSRLPWRRHALYIQPLHPISTTLVVEYSSYLASMPSRNPRRPVAFPKKPVCTTRLGREIFCAITSSS